MRYDNPELIDQLAAAYVLGTLRGRARRRLERLSLERLPIREAIWRWENELVPLSDHVAPVSPAASVWRDIEARLNLNTAERSSGPAYGWGRVLAGFISGVVVLALLLPLLPEEPQAPIDSAAERLALVQDEQAQPLWVVTVDEESGQLMSVAVNAPARDADRVFELWMLPQSGPPQSLGLLPTSSDGNERGYQKLSPALLALIADAKGLAVSIEPLGGSPTGVPTGPVVYTAPVIKL